MVFRSLVVAAFLATAAGQAVAPPGGCLVCGNGSVVTAPDTVFAFPGQPEVPCGDLQAAGLSGQVPLDQCPFLPGLILDCDCMPGDLPAAPTDAPVSAPTPAPGSSTPCPDAPSNGCSVCGAGECVTNPDGIFGFPGQPAVPCVDLQQAGYNGQVPIDQCPFLPGLVAETCGCASSVPGGAPAPVPTVTPAPVAVVTPAPVDTPVPTENPDDGGGMGMGGMGKSKDASGKMGGMGKSKDASGDSGKGKGMMRRELRTQGTIRGL